MSLHGDLIKQAKDLYQKPVTDANIRRAVSAAYYAIFHRLLDAASAAFITDKYEFLRPAMKRIFEHKRMAEACGRILKLKEQPLAMATTMRGAVFPPNLDSVADTFIQLQQARLEADYNMERQFTPSEAEELVGYAESAINLIDSFVDTPHLTLLFIAFLEPKQIRLSPEQSEKQKKPSKTKTDPSG